MRANERTIKFKTVTQAQAHAHGFAWKKLRLFKFVLYLRQMADMLQSNCWGRINAVLRRVFQVVRNTMRDQKEKGSLAAKMRKENVFCLIKEIVPRN